MAWTDLKAAVASVITTNGNNEITGAVLQSTLNTIVSNLGENAAFKGVATTSTNPGVPDGPLFYMAYEKGIYANFNAINLTEEDGLVILLYSGGWTKINIPLASKDELDQVRSDISETTDKLAELVPHVMFDISEYNAIDGVAKTYASLPDALVDVPAIAKHGGMSIKYVQSSDDEYVQYRLMSDTFNTTPANWQGVDDEPVAGSENLVKSGGVYNAIESLERLQEQDKFSISDEQGYNIVDFENEHIKTKGFNSEEAAVSKLAVKSFSISDEQGYNIVDFENGHIKTKGFNSEEAAVPKLAVKAFSISDGEGYSIVDFEDGDIKTKNFDSSKIRNSPPAGTLKLPVSYIPIYITCNDLNTSNGWGIGTRNKSVNIFLDHFFHTDRELNVVFENGSTFYTVTQSIKGEGDVWNGDWVKYEFQEELNVNEDMLKIKVRSILNSETSGIYPKVLQIGDSVTAGWFANYPIVNNAPVQSFSWAKYYFLKDAAEQAGGNYKSLFVGRGSKTEFSYDGVSGIAYAEGKGGKTAKWYVTNQDSPFYTQNGFSLLSYLHKYKTLDIDGETRLVVGSTAGTEVTDVMSWDLCTPNVVVIQLGMNDVLSEWKTYMPQIVNSIKTEFPDMKVIISVLDGCTCNYPSLYPNYQNIFFDNFRSAHTKLMEAYCYALDNWQDEENGIYVLYSGMVMPMPMSCNVRETDGSFDGSIKRYVGVDSIERVPHPSRYAHQEIGYLLYSCIKWILS
jgi:hypothetical protein